MPGGDAGALFSYGWPKFGSHDEVFRAVVHTREGGRLRIELC